MNFKSVLKMAMVTMGCMFIANMVAAMSPGARKLFKGSVVSVVNAAPSSGSIAV